MRLADLAEMRRVIGLVPNSLVRLFNTEGAADPDHHAKLGGLRHDQSRVT
jgi:hypothetical protein